MYSILTDNPTVTTTTSTVQPMQVTTVQNIAAKCALNDIKMHRIPHGPPEATQNALQECQKGIAELKIALQDLSRDQHEQVRATLRMMQPAVNFGILGSHEHRNFKVPTPTRPLGVFPKEHPWEPQERPTAYHSDFTPPSAIIRTKPENGESYKRLCRQAAYQNSLKGDHHYQPSPPAPTYATSSTTPVSASTLNTLPPYLQGPGRIPLQPRNSSTPTLVTPNNAIRNPYLKREHTPHPSVRSTVPRPPPPRNPYLKKKYHNFKK